MLHRDKRPLEDVALCAGLDPLCKDRVLPHFRVRDFGVPCVNGELEAVAQVLDQTIEQGTLAEPAGVDDPDVVTQDLRRGLDGPPWRAVKASSAAT